MGTLLLSHDSGNVGLLGPPSSTATTTNSDLSETFNVNGNDILRIVKEHDANGENDDDDDDDDDDYFPKKLARQFRKHRWKLNGENSRALTTILQKTTTPSSSINVPITSNRTAKIIPQTHYEEEEEESEDAHNYGREEFDKIIIPSSPIDPVTGRNKTRTIHEDPHNDGYNDELHNLPLDIVKVKSSPSSTTTALTVEGKNLSRNRNESEDDSMKRMLNMKKVVDVELFKINNNDNDNFRFHADDSVVNNFDDTFNAAQLPRNNNNNNSERIIAQLVNVTTEDVYISLESDEELGEDSFKNHKLSRVAAGGSNSNFGDKLGNMLVKPEASFEQGSIIKVNSSGIFPVSNLSSIWEGQSSRNKNSNNKKERNYSDKPTQSRINENSSEDFVDEEKDGEEMDEEDGKEGKTLMMRRRPRRSVVHLYDMVVCATGCNPLIYKGYGCFCGFMGNPKHILKFLMAVIYPLF